MFSNSQVMYQPAFYLLIAAGLLLTIGFRWGRRFNNRILHGTFDVVLDVLKSKDQQFTNIGGQTGYHANFLPAALKSVRRVDATLTMLPRQSLLYLPFSYLIQRFDRLYLNFYLNKKGRGTIAEGHLIDARFEKMRGNRIEHDLTVETFDWGGETYHLYSADETIRAALLDLKERIGDAPGNFRHAALVPEEDKAYLFQIPSPTTVGPILSAFAAWLDELVENRRKKAGTTE